MAAAQREIGMTADDAMALSLFRARSVRDFHP